MDTCIAFYSKTGNTAVAAEYLAEKIGAKAIRLEDQTKYKGLIGFIKGGMNASRAKVAALKSELYEEIAKYDRVVLATPVWAGKTTPAINAVLKNVDFFDKEVYVMTTQADPEAKDADNRKQFYKEVIDGKGGKLVQLFSLCGSPPGKAAKAKEEMERQVDETVKIG